MEAYSANDFGVTWSSGYYEGQYNTNPPQQWAADAGATWDRWDIHWNWVMQTRPGATPPVWAGQSPGEPSYTYSYPEAIDGAGTTSPALNVLAVLNGGLLPDDQIGPNPYDEGGTWQTFVEAAYEQYGGQVAAWELGNETGFVHEDPHDPQSQPPLTPEEYAQALRTTCHVLGEDSTIILGSPMAQVGLSLANEEHGYQEHEEQAAHGWETYQGILDAIKEDPDLQKCVDAIGIHAYLRVPWSYWIATGIDAYARSEPFKWSDPNVWITEAGLAAGHEGVPCESAEQGSDCESEEVQAEYVLQQYAMAKQAFGETDQSQDVGTILHHCLRDGCGGTYGLVSYPDNRPWPSFYAAWLTTSLLGDTEFFDDRSDEGYKHLVFDGREGEKIHVLWSITPQDVTVSFKPDTYRSARFYYRSDARSHFEERRKPDPQSVDPDSEEFRVTLFGTESRNGGAGDDPYQEDTGNEGWPSNYFVGGETVIVVESPATPPQGEASVICENGQAVGTDLWGYDADSGLASLSYACSPEKTYDLSWTEPGRTYAGTVDATPPEDGACTLTLTDRDGLTATQTIRNACESDPGSNPGGDHPDDNHSAAGLSIPSGDFVALPKGARTPPQVAILNRGAAHGLWRTLLRIGEPSARVEPDFDPVATAARYPVLLIPSGGLHGMATPPSQGGAGGGSFRARLEEYARRGGTIVAFAQQRASGRIGESAISRPAVLLYRHVILVYADGEPGRLFVVHLVIVRCLPPPPYVSA